MSCPIEPEGDKLGQGKNQGTCETSNANIVGLYAKGNLIEFSLHICSCPNLTTGSNYSPDQLNSSTYNMIARIMEIEQDLVNRVAPVQT
jgi:hypothetical protein